MARDLLRWNDVLVPLADYDELIRDAQLYGTVFVAPTDDTQGDERVYCRIDPALVKDSDAYRRRIVVSDTRVQVLGGPLDGLEIDVDQERTDLTINPRGNL